MLIFVNYWQNEKKNSVESIDNQNLNFLSFYFASHADLSSTIHFLALIEIVDRNKNTKTFFMH